MIFLFLLLPLFLFGSSEEEAARTIFAHLKVHDPQSAVESGKKLIELHSESKAVRLAYLQALAEKGDEAEVFRAWRGWQEGLAKDRKALEVLAWSVLKKGELSPQTYIHLSSLIGASLTRDVRAVPMLMAAMRSSSALFRLFGVRFAAYLGDGALQEELARLLEEETVWFVRQEVIRAVGQLRIAPLKPHLMRLVAKERGLVEEQVEAILALVHLYDGVRRSDLEKLCLSKRAGLKRLGCELIGYYNLGAEAPFLKTMLADASPEVRAHALETLGFLQERVDEIKLRALLLDPHPLVAITAAWVLCRQGEQEAQAEGVEAMRQWLSDIHPKWRWMAAALFSRCGPKAYPAMENALKTHDDRFVKVNLALGLIGQRTSLEAACEALDAFLHDSETGCLMWDEAASHRMMVPSRVFHIEGIQNYPKIVDQLARLDLLNILCMLKYPKALDVVKHFVQEEAGRALGPAARVLLQEGDEEALAVIGQLLKEADPQVRVQAALMLAFYGSDPEAIQILQSAYHEVDREMKIQILEAIGHVGSYDSIPFLIEILGEPFQLMRVIAASAIVQCLYH